MTSVFHGVLVGRLLEYAEFPLVTRRYVRYFLFVALVYVNQGSVSTKGICRYLHGQMGWGVCFISGGYGLCGPWTPLVAVQCAREI